VFAKLANDWQTSGFEILRIRGRSQQLNGVVSALIFCLSVPC